MSPSTLETLGQFFGCYFHQDFRSDYGRPEKAIDAYIEENSNNFVELQNALNEVVELNLSENELRELIRKCDSNYGPWIVNEYTAKEWISYIYGRLNEATHR